MIQPAIRRAGGPSGRSRCALAVGLLALLCACSPAPPRDSGSTDVFLVGLIAEGGTWRAGPPLRVTDRDGYDNQPAFSADGQRLLFSSRRGEQADIYAYDLADRRLRPLTRTLESEYSPEPIPGDPRFSAIRVERDGRQRLWAFGEDPESTELLLERPDYVAYYAWVDGGTLVLTVLGASSTLHRADPSTGRLSAALAEDVGRSLQRVPGKDAVSYVAPRGRNGEGDGGERWIHELDLATGRSRPIVAALAGAEDHAWLPDGSLLMAQGSALLRWGPDTLGLWAEVADFSGDGVRSITRLALDPAGRALAFVAAHE